MALYLGTGPACLPVPERAGAGKRPFFGAWARDPRGAAAARPAGRTARARPPVQRAPQRRIEAVRHLIRSHHPEATPPGAQRRDDGGSPADLAQKPGAGAMRPPFSLPVERP